MAAARLPAINGRSTVRALARSVPGFRSRPEWQGTTTVRVGSPAKAGFVVDRIVGSHYVLKYPEARPSSGPKSVDSDTDLARCFLRLANLAGLPARPA